MCKLIIAVARRHCLECLTESDSCAIHAMYNFWSLSISFQFICVYSECLLRWFSADLTLTFIDLCFFFGQIFCFNKFLFILRIWNLIFFVYVDFFGRLDGQRILFHNVVVIFYEIAQILYFEIFFGVRDYDQKMFYVLVWCNV